ncbi:RBBP9/YdeN family alpha/beta hydrolase [Aquisediminimonas sediminicola]|uniref:RBBP9/YdeN family alpha/beta hydrolase n=1 Tax=Alteraquisediminimonas sediminicola TaxID=2676787 RepID=UPI001C8D99BD|nr:alpha/beta fold hydrolase [Aquisediminimonas sediminicola]
MVDLGNVTALFVPGLRDHVEDHWQTHAACDFPGSVTVEPLRIDGLSRAARIDALDEAIRAIDGDVILVAHSAGCLMVAHWAATRAVDMLLKKVRAALLVTPADVERPLPEGYPKMADLDANGWLPIPRAALPFPTTVVASRNDPLAEYGRVKELAHNWCARLIDAGEVGHLNPAAGFGPWQKANDLIKQLARETP